MWISGPRPIVGQLVPRNSASIFYPSEMGDPPHVLRSPRRSETRFRRSAHHFSGAIFVESLSREHNHGIWGFHSARTHRIMIAGTSGDLMGLGS